MYVPDAGFLRKGKRAADLGTVAVSGQAPPWNGLMALM